MVAHLEILRQLPLSFLPSLLRESIDYDYRFPAEREALDRELASPGRALSSGANQFALRAILEGGALPEPWSCLDWINQPAQFVEQQAAYLWSHAPARCFS